MPNFVLVEHMAKQLEVIVSNPYMTCQRLIPFQKLRGLQCLNLHVVTFEFEPCNIYGIRYIEPFIFSRLKQTVHPGEPHVVHRTHLDLADRFFCVA